MMGSRSAPAGRSPSSREKTYRARSPTRGMSERDSVDVDFGESGLVPAVAQDAETGEAHYYSRSREELWHKGASSGHTQTIEEVRVDCDADALLYVVEQEGGACHTGYRSCFHRTVDGEHVGEQVFDPAAVYED